MASPTLTILIQPTHTIKPEIHRIPACGRNNFSRKYLTPSNGLGRYHGHWRWLRKLGLRQYETAFVANAIDCDVLQELTEADFEKMGIPLGDRKRLMRAISALSPGSPRAVTRTDIGKMRKTRRVLNAVTSR